MRIDYTQIQTAGDQPIFEVHVGGELVAVGTAKECGRALLKQYGLHAIAEAVGTMRTLSTPADAPATEFAFTEAKKAIRSQRPSVGRALLSNGKLPDYIEVPANLEIGLGDPQALPPWNIERAS